jgi:hypothetical protein
MRMIIAAILVLAELFFWGLVVVLAGIFLLSWKMVLVGLAMLVAVAASFLATGWVVRRH